MTWVHFDRRERPSDCSRGIYALIVQDDLNTLGFRTGGLYGVYGVFGAQTRNAVISYQRSRGLTADGIVVCNTCLSFQEYIKK